jgi:chromosome segregation protein
MYLKQIELSGFKSFALKTKFEFHSGITGIVGPNGSGKSNVSDAVRWVLGEQRAKQLRGANMQDVIFAGTENRKPVSYASVSLTLDNSDHVLPVEYKEVTVTRKIYRSGESEYLLNGTNCRLRDIQELFYDTGVGKEGYSLIGQGQIERILNGKPQERRELFDEAAGIVKYKRRKSTAQKKLENEQENLVRVNDIIYELEKQVGPLKRASEKAKIYLQKREEQKILDLQLYAIQVEKAEKEEAELNKNISILTAQLNEVRSSYEKGKQDSGKIEATMENLENQISQLRKLQSEDSLKKQGSEHQIELLKAEIRAEELSGAHYSKRLEDLSQEIAEKEKERKSYENRVKENLQKQTNILKEREEIAASLKEINGKIQGLRDRAEEIQNEILGLMEQKTSAETRNQHFNTLMEQIQLQKKQLSEDENTAKEELALREEELKSWQEKYREKAAEQKSFDEMIRKEEALLQELTKKRDDLARRYEEKDREYMRRQSRKDALTNLAERYEGYGNSIRKVMEKKQAGSGIIGVVADIIRVEKAYETAIETALGGSIQNVVTEDEASARRMIDYLKKNRFGRATFLPLTSVKKRSRAREEDALHEPGVIGLADSLVHTEERFSGIVSSLLGGILVVDRIEHALNIAKKYHYSMRIVTQEGEFLRPGGSLTGGAFKNNSNLLGRNRELEQLQKEIEELDRSRKEIRREQEAVKEGRLNQREKIEKAKQEASRREVDANTARMNVSRLEDIVRQTRNRLERIAEDTATAGNRLLQMEKEGKSVSSESQRLEDKRKSLEEENEGISQQLKEKLQERSGVEKESEELSKSEASFDSTQNFLRENQERIGRELLKLKEDRDEITKTQSEAKAGSSEKREEIEQLRKEIDRLGKELFDTEEKLNKAVSARDELNVSYREFFEKREEMTRQIADLEKEEYRLNSRAEQLGQQIENRDAYIWEEYELTRNHALEMALPTEESPAEISKRTKEIRSQIRELGNVNVNAIEEYKEVSERYEFLSAQRADMEEARENLEQMIGSLDNGMRRQFREQFERIQKEFQKVFQTLFGGGKGSLNLTDGDDILEAGIEINAQPPGKKLQNMMQLSGGEKSLTAIALLFAIQNLKPSPFCILDEIEAALDEPNVDRFAQYLQKLSHSTQFIVITHRRGTMGAADRLYGITMQEKGVSAQVSVDLAEEEIERDKKKNE